MNINLSGEKVTLNQQKIIIELIYK